MKFPPDYPYSPPSIRFLTKVWHPNVYEVSITTIPLFWDHSLSLSSTERRPVHLDSASARRRSAKRRTAVRTMEPDAERAHNIAVGDFSAERAEHVFAGERGRLGDVPALARIARQGQRVSEHYSVGVKLKPSRQSSTQLKLIYFWHVGRKQALAAKIEAEKEGIVVPMTLEDYCLKPKKKPVAPEPPVFVHPFLVLLS